MRYSFTHTAVGTKEKQEISIHVSDEIDFFFYLHVPDIFSTLPVNLKLSSTAWGTACMHRIMPNECLSYMSEL